MKILTGLKNPFVREWVRFNFWGTLLGVLMGPILFYLVIDSAMLTWLDYEKSYDIYQKLESLFLTIPLGAALGYLQQIKLRQWKVSSVAWIAATILGLGIPATIGGWIVNSTFKNDIIRNTLIIELIMIGLGIGGFQGIVIRKFLPNPFPWILAYIKGVFIIGVVEFCIMLGTYGIAEPVEKLFYFVGLYELVYYRDLVLIIFLFFLLPFLIAIFIGLPTGIILQKLEDTNSNQKGSE